jgi:hypothetical protein
MLQQSLKNLLQQSLKNLLQQSLKHLLHQCHYILLGCPLGNSHIQQLSELMNHPHTTMVHGVCD